MSEKPSRRIAAFYALGPRNYPLLEEFSIVQDTAGLTLLVVATSRDRLSRLSMRFTRVAELSIDWPQWSIVTLDVVDIQDITDRSMENMNYRVYEGAGLFRFSCTDFFSIVDVIEP